MTYSIESYQPLLRKKGVPQALANPRNPKTNPIPISHLKKSVKKSNPCHQCNPCLNFCPSPKADGHYYSLIYSIRVSHGCIHSVLPLCPQPSAWTLIKKRNTDITDFTQVGLSRIFFDIIWLKILGFGLDFFGFASVDTLPFLAVSVLLLRISTSAPT